MKLTVEQAEAITHLLNVPEFRVFMDMIGQRGEEAMKVYVLATSGLETKQGKCQVYSELVDDISSAKRTLEDYQNSK